jgi:hypothetical protein
MTALQPQLLKGNLRTVFTISRVLILLFVLLSLSGLVFPRVIYPDEDLRLSFLPNDFVNLLVGLPMLTWSCILTRKKRLLGILCYPGALFYSTYVYATYLLGMPFSVLFIPYLLVVGLSIYALTGMVKTMNLKEIGTMLEGRVPVRSSGILLLSIAVLLMAYQVYAIIMTLIQSESPDQLVLAQWIVDLLLAAPPLMIISIFMIGRKPEGYALGMSVLFLLSGLFISLVPFMIIQGVMAGTALNVTDMVVVVFSSLICVIPFVLFVRGLEG